MSVWWRPLGCVLWLDFAEPDGTKAYDLSGYGNHGTIYGASRRRGPLLRSLSFDGVDDYVDVPYGDVLKIPRRYTVEALGKPLTDKVNILIGEWNGYRAWMTGTEISAGSYLVAVGWRILAYYTGTLGKWWHTVYVRDDLAHYLYVNGEKVSEGSLPDADTHYASPRVMVGAATSGDGVTPYPDYYFDGGIALVRVYSRALSPEEVWAHYCYLKSAVMEAP